ncbi:hypothetical protein [Streptomyces sp. TRM68416]|uniref:hypothetical protein n=1 Tax=Streptomyces sp. TRM68416 TaxID=2758412 RepID=UPI001661A6C8|nr:hypothetical protein [Streptomyces sp. TRM68416]MBD0840157.1 hypothetical protein [Streptomyces sp. TRM68416]
MPFPPPSRVPSGPRRRSLLVSVAGGALLVGCSGGSDDSGGTGGSPSAADRARARAARDSAELVERYDAVIAAHPALAERLRPLRAETVRHAEAFGGTAARPVPPSGPASAPAAPAVVPADEKAALASLAADERALADRRTEALLGLPGESARLLASVAAAGAAHVFLLTEGAR